MIVVSNDFKAAMKQPVKELQAFIDCGDLVIRDDGYSNSDGDHSDGGLISFKVSCDSGLCKSAMRKLEAKYLGEHNLVGKWVSAGFGVKLASGTFEYLDYGSFLVSEQTTTKDTGVTEIVAYDKMVEAMKPYDPKAVNVSYPIDLYTYTELLCDACGLELYPNCMPVNDHLVVERELWENISGITYRDIFVQIAQATASTCVICDDKVCFKPITATMEQLTYDNLLKLKLEPMYGEINSIVISREPIQGEAVYFKDDESIDLYGLTEFRIENNEIVDKDRDAAIGGIADELIGKSYYPFEATTEGLGWYEIGDYITVVNEAGDDLSTIVWSFSISIDGGIKETLKATAETKTQTQYQYATTLAKRIKNAEIIVNKQDNEIQALVKDMYDEDGVVNEKYTQIHQDIENITLGVQNSGGVNLLKNSAMFAYDSDGKPYEWVVSDGGLTIQSDAISLQHGGISGHSFTLTDNEVRQTVNVQVSTYDKPTYYTFSCRVKKDVVGECSVTLINDYEDNDLTLVHDGESAYYEEYSITVQPKQDYYKIVLSSNGGNGATFTDCMFAVGDSKHQWTQANGEVMNTQVNVSVDGVVVRRVDEYGNVNGDYTAMTPLEFAGYSNDKRVFSLNKDVTKVQKLEAVDEITMGTIKIVPITDGDMQGWAFVPTTQGGDE